MKTTWSMDLPRYPKLKTNITTDVCVVGGGLAGIWIAYLLGQAGKNVVVLERKRVGSGQTANTTAFITQVVDTPLSELVKMFGRNTAKLVWESGARAIDQIEETIKKEDINCEFIRTPYAEYALSESDMEYLTKEYELAKSLGFKVSLTTPLKEFKNFGTMEVLNQAKYHPMKFICGLLNTMPENVTIYENTEVEKIIGTSSITVGIKGGPNVTTSKVVVATYDPFNNPKPVHLKKGMYTSYVYELRTKSGALKEGMYADLHNPYQYFRVDRLNSKYDRVIIGGEDHRSEMKKLLQRKSFKALDEYIQKVFPKLRYTIMNKWTGGILEPTDGLALIGEYEPNKYLCSAFSGNGMTYSAISAMIIRDLILRKVNPWTKVYDPKRSISFKTLSLKARDYAGEFIGGAGKNIFK